MSCEHSTKIKYESEAQAHAYAVLWQQKYGRRMKSYWCDDGHWHLATKRSWGGKKSRQRRLQKRRSKRRMELALATWEDEGGALYDDRDRDGTADADEDGAPVGAPAVPDLLPELQERGAV